MVDCPSISCKLETYNVIVGVCMLALMTSAIFLPLWLVASSGSGASIGMWIKCDIYVCKDLDNSISFVQATQALAILAFILCIIHVGSLVMLRWFYRIKPFFWIAAASGVSSAFFFIISFSVFLGKLDSTGVSEGYSYGSSFNIAISALLDSVLSVLFTVLLYKDVDMYTQID